MSYYKHFVYEVINTTDDNLINSQTYIATRVNNKSEDQYKVPNCIAPVLFLEQNIKNQTEALIKANVFYYLCPIFDLISETTSIRLFVYDYHIINNINSENSIEFTDSLQDSSSENNFQIITNDKTDILITLKCANYEKISMIDLEKELLNTKFQLQNKKTNKAFSDLALKQIHLNENFITLTFKYYEN